MDRIREAGNQLSTSASLPASLTGTAQGETEDKLLTVIAAVAEKIVAHAHSVGTSNDLVAKMRADTAIVGELSRLITGVGKDEATGIALRLCAGCVDGAKVPRAEEMNYTTGKPMIRPVTNDERKGDMEVLDDKCDALNDAIYTAGVGIGPLDKLLRNRQQPTFDGIAPDLLEKRYPEYHRRYPPAKTTP